MCRLGAKHGKEAAASNCCYGEQRVKSVDAPTLGPFNMKLEADPIMARCTPGCKSVGLLIDRLQSVSFRCRMRVKFNFPESVQIFFDEQTKMKRPSS